VIVRHPASAGALTDGATEIVIEIVMDQSARYG
jgi:hypothetical protein